MRKTMTSRRSLLWLVPLLVLFTACGSDGGTQGGSDAGIEGRDGGPADITPSDDTVEIGDEPYVPEDLTCVLIPSVGGDIFVSMENAVQVGVYQYSLETGEVMPEQMVSFAVLEDESVDARLSVANSRTDDTGLAAVNLTAGTEPGTVIVRVASPCAASVDIEVDVLDLPIGDLRVNFNYPYSEILELSPVRAEAYLPDTLRCRDFRPGFIPTGAIREGEAASPGGSVEFNALMEDEEYTIIAVGFGPYGERAAQGCVDRVTIREATVVDVQVDMFLLPLNPVGTYDVISHWDFRDAIADSGPVGEMIVQILDIFEDPGHGILDFVLDLVADAVGGIISGTIDLFLDMTGLDDVAADAITDLIDSSPFLSDVFTIGRDLRSIIAELEVISTLEIGKLGSDYEVFGIDNWLGLAVYWRLNCEEGAPADCGRIPLEIDNADLGLLRGEWTGRVIGYNRLDIDRHPVDFAYGRLILFVLDYMVIPVMVGDCSLDDVFGGGGCDHPVTLEDLMFRIFNCEGIGNAIAGDGDSLCALGACVSDDDIEGYCEDFVSFVFGSLFTGLVNALSFDAVLDMRGQCTMVNNDPDLDVDLLSDGEYVGAIQINGSMTPFITDFAGERAGE